MTVVGLSLHLFGHGLMFAHYYPWSGEIWLRLCCDGLLHQDWHVASPKV